MTRFEAIEIARAAAKAGRPSYYAEPFEPHPWVVDAIMAASDLERAAIEPLRRDRDEAVACREGWRGEIDGARAALRREQDARAQLRVELDETKRIGLMACRRAHDLVTAAGSGDYAWITEARARLEGVEDVRDLATLLADSEARARNSERVTEDARSDLERVKAARDEACEMLLRGDGTISTYERAHQLLEVGAAPQQCCPSSTLPGSKHDIGCRAGGKVH